MDPMKLAGMVMNRNTKIIIIVLALLTVTTAVGATLNAQYAREKKALLDAVEIAVLENGAEVARLTMDDIGRLPTEEFTARLKSSIMKAPEEHLYTGIVFSQLFKAAGLSLEDRNRVIVHSVDGYAVPLTIEEIEEMNNVYLVYKDNGAYLGSYNDKGGQGPYMVVVRGDRFSQRWAKYVCELDIQ